MHTVINSHYLYLPQIRYKYITQISIHNFFPCLLTFAILHFSKITSQNQTDLMVHLIGKYWYLQYPSSESGIFQVSPKNIYTLIKSPLNTVMGWQKQLFIQSLLCAKALKVIYNMKARRVPTRLKIPLHFPPIFLRVCYKKRRCEAGASFCLFVLFCLLMPIWDRSRCAIRYVFFPG